MLIHRFGSTGSQSSRLHCMVLDSVNSHSDGEPVFVAATAPTAKVLQSLLHKTRWPHPQAAHPSGRRSAGQDWIYMAADTADPDDAHTLRPLQAAAGRSPTPAGGATTRFPPDADASSCAGSMTPPHGFVDGGDVCRDGWRASETGRSRGVPADGRPASLENDSDRAIREVHGNDIEAAKQTMG